MRNTNTRTRKLRIVLIAMLCLLLEIAIVIPFFFVGTSANAAGEELTFVGHCSVKEIKTNALDKEFIVYGEVTNNTTSIFGSQFTINIDTTVFEFKSYIGPGDIATELGLPAPAKALTATENKAGSKPEQGYVKLEVHDNGTPITLSSFIIGGYKIGVKAGAATTGKSEITLDSIGISDMKAKPMTYATSGTTISLGFAAPSTACDITALSSTQSGVSIAKDGNNFKAEVENSVATLNTGSLKATVSDGAKVTYSPTGNVSLKVGENTITITVTAEDGTSRKTAALTVTRKEASPNQGNNPSGGNNSNDGDGDNNQNGGENQDPNGDNNQNGGDDQNPNGGNNNASQGNNIDSSSKFPYILATSFLGVDCVMAGLIMIIMAAKRRRR